MRIEAESPFLEEIADNLVYPEGSQGRSDEIARWKNLLATCTTNESKTRQLRAILSKELVARAKRYAELAHTLAEAIQFKSPLPLEQKYGTPEGG